MDDVEAMVIEAACTRLIHAYVHLADQGDHEGVAALFTEDAVYARPSAPNDPVEGRAAILEAFNARSPRLSRHLVANVLITVESAERARGVSYLTLYTAASGQEGLPKADARALIGGFDDVFAKRDGHWLFASRRGWLSLQLGQLPTA